MLSGFVVESGRLIQILKDENPVRDDTVWLDLVAPDEEEREIVLNGFHQPLPEHSEFEEIEATSRFYLNEDGLHIHSYFIDDPHLAFYADVNAPKNVTAALTINGGRLFSVREEELAVFRMFRMRARNNPGMVEDGIGVLLGLFETKVDLIADLLERLYKELEAAGQQVFEGSSHDMHNVLSTITRFEDLNGKLRLVLLDTQRAMRFLLRHGALGAQEQEAVKEILRDVDSLTPHTNYLFEKVNFLMEASAGIINVEQNKIIKVMTLASVVFLPPTLIASLYGMNFRFMPELQWEWGYPFAIGAMLVSALAPIAWFKRKGWL
ncbi:MAG: magnesium/cobalt transporter CorA [bacterium]